MAESKIKALGSVTTLASSIQSGTSPVGFNLSNNIKNYKYICIKASADNYDDYKFIPTRILNVMDSINGKGVYLKIYANNEYYWEGNVAFYTSGDAGEITTKSWGGWRAFISIYGIN